MSWNKLVLAFPVMLTAIACGQGKCPAYQGKSALTTVDLFDGPPEQKADLVPDKSTGSMERGYALWKVGYIFTQGRTLYVVCSYSGSDSKPVTIKVAKKVHSCVFRAYGKARPAELNCK
jgi:hypothetical protein